MKRKPQGWPERFEASLESHANPALEEWRWAREGEEPVDPRAASAAWDLVTQQASAEAAKLHHAMRLIENPAARTLLPALVVAGARMTPIGALRVEAHDGSAWHPRDLAFVPGREPIEPDLVIRCGAEIARSHLDFLVRYQHRSYAGDALEEIVRERSMAILTIGADLGPKATRDRQMRDRELQAEGLLIVQPTRSEVWRDPVGVAEEALRTLIESTRFESEAAAASQEGR